MEKTALDEGNHTTVEYPKLRCGKVDRGILWRLSTRRASRRAVQQAVDAAEAEARAHQVAEHWVRGYNQQGGVSMRRDARLGKGRRRHLLETPPVEGP